MSPRSLGWLVPVGALLSLCGTAQGAVTVGPDVVSTPSSGARGCVTAGSRNTLFNAGGIGVSPLSGVAVRFRVRADSAGANGIAPTFRIVHPAGGGTYTGAGSTAQFPFASGVSTNEARLAVSAGDSIGVDVICDSSAVTRQYVQRGSIVGANAVGFNPGLPDNSAPQSPNITDGANQAFLVNADVEPDADQDVFGDETQDRCPGVKGSNAGCTSPTIELKRTKNSSIGKLVVKVSSDEPATVTVGGKVAHRFLLGSRSVTLVAGQPTKVKLKLAGRDLGQARRALAGGEDLKAKVTAKGQDVVGDLGAAKPIKIRLG